jgi:hypothetical protein
MSGFASSKKAAMIVKPLLRTAPLLAQYLNIDKRSKWFFGVYVVSFKFLRIFEYLNIRVSDCQPIIYIQILASSNTQTTVGWRAEFIPPFKAVPFCNP